MAQTVIATFMKFGRSFAIAATVLASSAVVSTAEADGSRHLCGYGDGHSGGISWAAQLAGSAVRGIAEGLAENVAEQAYVSPTYGYVTGY